MSNTAIWDAVQATDPRFTKGFSRSGGFKGTATNATYLARKATEQFGPMGTGWGLNVLDETLLQGAPVMADGVVVGHVQVHRVHARLWYVLDGKRGEIEQFGQTEFVGRNKNGWFTDEEAPKKSLTDAMTKCLSLLGFSADIHLGLYDDNKYVAGLREQFAEPPEGVEWLDAIEGASSVDELNKLADELRTANLSEVTLKAVRRAWAARAKALPKPEGQTA